MSRIERVNELIYRELAVLCSRNIDLPLDSFVSITNVDVSKDLKHANIWVSIFPANKKMQTLRALEKKRRFLESALRKKLKIKFIPNLEFKIDRTEEEAIKIETLIDSVSEK